MLQLMYYSLMNLRQFFSMANDYYVYIYRNPLKENQPFYVGKGRGSRHKHHLTKKCARSYNLHKTRTIDVILKQTGSVPPIEIYRENLTNAQACEVEKNLILLFGRVDLATGVLTNMTDGGDGNNNFSEETRKRIGMKLKGVPHSAERRAFAAAAMIGRAVSDDTRRNCPQGTETKSLGQRGLH